MKFPGLLKPHVDLPAGGDPLPAVVARFERDGAVALSSEARVAVLDAGRMRFNVSPLASCGEVRFAVEDRPGRARLEYAFSLDLTGGAGVACILAALAVSAWFIAQGRVAPAFIAALFYGIGLGATYFGYSAAISRTAAAARASPDGVPRPHELAGVQPSRGLLSPSC